MLLVRWRHRAFFILVTFVGVGVGLAIVNLLIVGYLQPLSRYYYEQLQFELRSGARREPNTKATTVELLDGLEAEGVVQRLWDQRVRRDDALRLVRHDLRRLPVFARVELALLREDLLQGGVAAIVFDLAHSRHGVYLRRAD